MTAEVVVLNKHAVALAADSAATVDAKIFPVNKLFALSKFQPVGIMINGDADFLGIPWETVIKKFRQENKEAAHAHLQEYEKSFLAYLEGLSDTLNGSEHDQEVRHTLGDFLEHYRKVMSVRAWTEITADPGTDAYKSQLEKIGREGIDEEIKRICANRKIITVDDAEVRKLAGRVAEYFRNAQARVLMFRVPDDRLVDLLKPLLEHQHEFGPNSGIVVAGFGTAEWFPSVTSFAFYGTVGKKLKIAEERMANISDGLPAYVKGFAQDDVVEAFMNGIDPQYKDDLLGMIELVLTKTYPAEILHHFKVTEDAAKQTLQAITSRLGNEALKKIKEDLTEYQQKNFKTPIETAVQFLSRGELAAFAESLVQTTSLKRRVVFDSKESVGGPIDVAIVSKSEGFVWVKRKHYFDPQLNPSFAQRAISM